MFSGAGWPGVDSGDKTWCGPALRQVLLSLGHDISVFAAREAGGEGSVIAEGRGRSIVVQFMQREAEALQAGQHFQGIAARLA